MSTAFRNRELNLGKSPFHQHLGPFAFHVWLTFRVPLWSPVALAHLPSGGEVVGPIGRHRGTKEGGAGAGLYPQPL